MEIKALRAEEARLERGASPEGPTIAEDKARWAVQRLKEQWERSEKGRIAQMDEAGQKGVWLKAFAEDGIIEEACERTGISRYRVGQWRRKDAAIAEVINGAMEVHKEMADTWLVDYARGYIQASQGQVELHKMLFFVWRKEQAEQAKQLPESGGIVYVPSGEKGSGDAG